MSSSPQGSSDGSGSTRPLKPRPQPLDLPRDARYGTMDGATPNPNSRRGSRSVTRDSTETVPLWNYVASPHSPLVKIRDHCHQQWVAVLLTCLLLAITTYFVFGLSAPMRADQCVTPFGTLLGDSNNIAAYSNCRSDYGGDKMDHFVSVGLQRLYTGAKWHALEYARRYWILSSLLTFPSLPSPEHLMGLETANAVNGRRGGRGSPIVTLERYTNLFLPRRVLKGGDADAAIGNLTGNPNNVSSRVLLMNRRAALPMERDLVVYGKTKKTLPDGHVAVVVAVRGPFRSVVAAGKDVHWFLVKNASDSGRMPLSPEATLPHELLAKDNGSAVRAATAEAKNKSDAATVNGVVEGSEKSKEAVAEGTSVLYYKVYVAEQNWDNAYWRSPTALIAEEHSAATAKNESQKQLARQAEKAATRQRTYTRVLLLHEYSKPHGFFLEDTHNNPILGWIRAPNEATSG